MDEKDKAWNAISDKYDKQVGETGDFYHRTYINPTLLEILGEVSGKSILDLGCGQGYFSRILARKGALVSGIDISDQLVQLAIESEVKEPLGIKYFVNDSSDLKDIKDSKFDLIISNMVFHDLRNIEGTIKECKRIIKKEGKLVFSLLHPMTDLSPRFKDDEGYYKKLRQYKSNITTKSDLGMPNYHRPVEYYFQLLFDNGFLITDFKEIVTPRGSEEETSLDKEKLFTRNELPLFLVVGARQSS